jgi:hypothetical protein
MTEVYTIVQTAEYRSFLSVITIAPNEEDTSQASKSLHVYAHSDAHATVASDILFQFLTTCDSRKVTLESTTICSDRLPVSGLAFSHFLVQAVI